MFGRDGRIALVTDLDAPRRKLVRIDPERPDPSGWSDLLVEDADGGVLDDVVLAGDAIVAVRSRHALSHLSIHDRASGALRAEVPLPGLGSAGVTGRPDEGSEVWIGYTDHVTPVPHPASGRGLGVGDRMGRSSRVEGERSAGRSPPARSPTSRPTARRCGCS